MNYSVSGFQEKLDLNIGLQLYSFVIIDNSITVNVCASGIDVIYY